jgi:hypothetical protein
LEQKLSVLPDTVLIHSSTWVAVVLVPQVKRVMLWGKSQIHNPRHQVIVLLPCATLASVGFEYLHFYAQCDTGLAAIAVGAVSEHATAPKATGNEFRVGGVVD